MNYQQLTDKAFKYHQSGKILEAEKIYNVLLEINPDDVNILNLYGLILIEKNNPQKAISILSKAAILNNSTYIMTNLAKAYYMAGNYNKAIILYSKIAKNEPNDDIFYSMAIAYKKLSKFDSAIDSYKKALAFNKNNTNVLYNLSVLYKETNNFQQALKYAIRAELVNDKDEDIQVLLAGLYEATNKYKKSIQHLDKAFRLNPNNLYLYNMAVLYSKLNKRENAILLYRQIIENDPNNYESYVNLSYLYKNTDDELSLLYAKRAYNINPNEKIVCLAYAQELKDLYMNDKSIEVLSNYTLRKKDASCYSLLAINYMDILCYDIALNYYNLALSLDPSNINYLHGKAMALKYLGKIEDAKLLMEYVVSKENSSIQSKITLGMMYLQDKNFDKGMQLYIQRSKDTKFEKLFKDKKWIQGVSLKDKNILVYSDCGLGDTLMFSRYLPALKQQSKSVVLQTDKELVQILSSNYRDIDVIRKSSLVENYDVVIPIMNLPYALGINFDNIPTPEKYLYINQDEVNKITKSKLFETDKLKVGIFYQGNKKVFKNRSINLEFFNKLFEMKNIQFYSFQITDDSFLPDNVIKLNNKIKDYNDTANLLSNIDIMVTIDSSIAHMAGALGVKTYLLLPYIAEWRWFNDTKTTPWYKSIRIIKQTSSNDWNSVISELLKELKNESK